MSNLIEKLNWRYAAKRMSGAEVESEKLNNILEAIQLAPSSMGLQPYNVLVISDPEVKKAIFEKAAPQPQILESSHLLVFTAWEKVTAQSIAEYINLIATTRNISVESLSGFHGAFNQILSRTEKDNFDWAARQAYIALGHAIVAAAVEGVDATPMEGFNGPELDKVLNLNEKGLRSVVMLTLGHRDHENDQLAKAKKVRRPKEELFINI